MGQKDVMNSDQCHIEQEIREYSIKNEDPGEKDYENLLNLIERAAKNGVDLNTPTQSGNTLFHEACAFLDRRHLFGQDCAVAVFSMCKTLLENGFDTTCAKARKEGENKKKSLLHPLHVLARHLLLYEGIFIDLISPVVENSITRIFQGVDREENSAVVKSAWVRDRLLGISDMETSCAPLGWVPFQSVLHLTLQGWGASSVYNNEDRNSDYLSEKLDKLISILEPYLCRDDFDTVINQKTELIGPKSFGRPLTLSNAEISVSRQMNVLDTFYKKNDDPISSTFFRRIRKQLENDLDSYGGNLFHRILTCVPVVPKSVVQRMVDIGIDPCVRDALHQNVFHLATDGCVIRAFANAIKPSSIEDTQPYRLEEMLIERDRYGRTPLDRMMDRYNAIQRSYSDDGIDKKIILSAILDLGDVMAYCARNLMQFDNSESESFRICFKEEMNKLLSFGIKNALVPVVRRSLDIGADPSYPLFDDGPDGPYPAIRDRIRAGESIDADIKNLKACIDELRHSKDMRRFDIYDPLCSDVRFITDLLDGRVMDRLVREMTYMRDLALNELQGLDTMPTVSDWSHEIDGIPLIHHAAMVNRLPAGIFKDPSMQKLLTIRDSQNRGVSYMAMLWGTLPGDYIGWSKKDRNGTTLAHHAAEIGCLPDNPALLKIKDSEGKTVEETVQTAISIGIIQKFWRNQPKLASELPVFRKKSMEINTGISEKLSESTLSL